MSAAENLEATENQLPENPIVQIMNVIQTPEIVQVVEDVTISANEEASHQLAAESIKTQHDAQTHASAQIVNENQAVTHSVSAESAANDDSYYSNSSAAEKHSVQADVHNIMAHSASTHSDESSAKAAALEQVSKTQRAVQEESTRVSFAVEEIENRTQAGVEQEMKAMNAVEDSSSTDGASQDLEAELAITAQTNAPKIG